jgi:hypothetical protein
MVFHCAWLSDEMRLLRDDLFLAAEIAEVTGAADGGRRGPTHLELLILDIIDDFLHILINDGPLTISIGDLHEGVLFAFFSGPVDKQLRRTLIT